MVLLFSLVACDGLVGVAQDPADLSTHPNTEADTDTDSDTDAASDTDADADTDTDTDTDLDTDTMLGGIALELRLDAAGSGGRRIVAQAVSTAEDGLTYLEPYRDVSAASFPLTLEVPIPPPGRQRALFDGAGSGAMFGVYAYDDLDADGFKDEDELVLAGTSQFLIYVADGAGAFPDDSWFGLAITEFEDDPQFFDPYGGFDLVDISPAALTVSGVSELTSTPDRMATVSFAEFDSDVSLPDRPIDVGYEAEWSFTLEEPLSDARIFQTEEMGTPMGMETLLAMYDTDGSGDTSLDDTFAAAVCDGDRMLVLAWLEPTADPWMGAVLAILGSRTGWNAWAMTEDEDGISPVSDPTALVLSEDCGF